MMVRDPMINSSSSTPLLGRNIVEPGMNPVVISLLDERLYFSSTRIMADDRYTGCRDKA